MDFKFLTEEHYKLPDRKKQLLQRVLWAKLGDLTKLAEFPRIIGLQAPRQSRKIQTEEGYTSSAIQLPFYNSTVARFQKNKDMFYPQLQPARP